MRTPVLIMLLSALQLSVASALAASLEDGIRTLQHGWAEARYRTPEPAQDRAFESLETEAGKLVAAYPERAEALVWQAIVLSTHAGVSGGLSALSRVKQARELLERAEHIDASVLDGSVYTSLGSLYYQVPGWPISFGDDDKAAEYLRKALAMAPDSIDANYFYGDFLREQHRYDEAEGYLQRAVQAPDRPDRPLADAGRREEARQALASLNRTASRD